MLNDSYTADARLRKRFEQSTVIVGVIGQFCDSWMASDIAIPTCAHALFGILLCSSIVGRYREESKRSGLICFDLNASIRHGSRRVYLLLYGLVGVRLMINAAGYVEHCGAGRTQFPFVNVGSPQSSVSHEVSGVYVMYGLIGLVLIRLLAAARRRTCEPAFLDGGAPPDVVTSSIQFLRKVATLAPGGRASIAAFKTRVP